MLVHLEGLSYNQYLNHWLRTTLLTNNNNNIYLCAPMHYARNIITLSSIFILYGAYLWILSVRILHSVHVMLGMR